MQVVGEETVRCVNDDGDFTIRLREAGVIGETGGNAVLYFFETVAQTCRCEFDQNSDELEAINDRAAEAHRRRSGSPLERPVAAR